MIEVEQEARKRVERALIVGVSAGNEDPGRVHVHLDELAELLGNLDIAVVGRAVAKLKGPAHAQFYVGTGKAEEIAAMVEELDADKDLVRVVISMFGRETPVDLELDQVEPVEQ